jgi:hypothetical protein
MRKPCRIRRCQPGQALGKTPGQLDHGSLGGQAAANQVMHGSEQRRLFAWAPVAQSQHDRQQSQQPGQRGAQSQQPPGGRRQGDGPGLDGPPFSVAEEV